MHVVRARCRRLDHASWCSTSRRCRARRYRIGVPDAGRYEKLLSSDDAEWGGSGSRRRSTTVDADAHSMSRLPQSDRDDASAARRRRCWRQGGHDRRVDPIDRRAADNSPSALHELAARVGIVPEYFDIARSRRNEPTTTRVARLLSALGFDASPSTAERDALDNDPERGTRRARARRCASCEQSTIRLSHARRARPGWSTPAVAHGGSRSSPKTASAHGTSGRCGEHGVADRSICPPSCRSAITSSHRALGRPANGSMSKH